MVGFICLRVHEGGANVWPSTKPICHDRGDRLFRGLLLDVPTFLMETGKKAFEDRSTEDQVTDTKIASGILAGLTDKDKSLLLDVQRRRLGATRDADRNVGMIQDCP